MEAASGHCLHHLLLPIPFFSLISGAPLLLRAISLACPMAKNPPFLSLSQLSHSVMLQCGLAGRGENFIKGLKERKRKEEKLNSVPPDRGSGKSVLMDIPMQPSHYFLFEPEKMRSLFSLARRGENRSQMSHAQIWHNTIWTLPFITGALH